VFLPLEESAFLAFSKAAQAQGGDADSDSSRVAAVARGQSAGQREEKVAAGRMLTVAIKAVTYIGLIVLSFGPPYSYVVLAVVYGSRYSSAEASVVLSCYCLLIPLLALNGVTEAFLNATASKKKLGSSSVVMGAFGIVYLLACSLLVRKLGAAGLVLANCCNMIVRIFYSVSFISSYFKGTSDSFLRRSLPPLLVLLALASSATVGYVSERHFLPFSPQRTAGLLPMTNKLQHVAVGATCFVGTLTIMYQCEKQFLVDIKSLLRKQSP